MPPITPDDFKPNHIVPEIVTNRLQAETPDNSFIFSAQILAGDGASKEIKLVVPPEQKAIIMSNSLRDSLRGDDTPHVLEYLSRDDVQGTCAGSDASGMLPDNLRIIRMMPILTLLQRGRERFPLVLRGAGAANKGHWGCASSLVGETINTASIYKTLNRETGILLDGTPAVFVPPQDIVEESSDIAMAAADAKKKMAGRISLLGIAFEKSRGSVEVVESTLKLPDPSHQVQLQGAMTGTLNCVAFDNPHQRTLTLIFPLVAKVRDDAIITVFNGEGYDGPTTLVTRDDMKVAGNAMPLIPGLRQFVHA
jgi:hypothetical protein